MKPEVRPPNRAGYLGKRLEQAFNSSFRSRPLKDSIQAFCHGEPGGLPLESEPVERGDDEVVSPNARPDAEQVLETTALVEVTPVAA